MGFTLGVYILFSPLFHPLFPGSLCFLSWFPFYLQALPCFILCPSPVQAPNAFARFLLNSIEQSIFSKQPLSTFQNSWVLTYMFNTRLPCVKLSPLSEWIFPPQSPPWDSRVSSPTLAFWTNLTKGKVHERGQGTQFSPSARCSPWPLIPHHSCSDQTKRNRKWNEYQQPLAPTFLPS